MGVYIGNSTNDVSVIAVGSMITGEVYVGSRKVWPAITSQNFEVVEGSVVVRYSSGTALLASGLNYAYLEGTVNVFDEDWEEIINVLYNQRLTPAFAGPEGNFYISGDEIRAYSLGTTQTDIGSADVSGCYGDSGYTEANSRVYQEANEIERTTYRPWSEWRLYGRDRINLGNYSAHITSSYFTTPATAASWLGEASVFALNYGASHDEVYNNHYSRERTVTYTWTSGATSSETERGTKDERGEPFAVEDSSAISVNPLGWLSVSRSNITIQRNNGELRSAVITVQNMQSITATASVTIYQARCPIPQLVPNFNNITISSTGLSMVASFNETYADGLAYRAEMRLAGYQTHNIDGTVGSSGALVQLNPTWSDLGLIPSHGAQYTLSVTTRVKLPEDTGWEYAKTWSGSTTITYP